MMYRNAALLEIHLLRPLHHPINAAIALLPGGKAKP